MEKSLRKKSTSNKRVSTMEKPLRKKSSSNNQSLSFSVVPYIEQSSFISTTIVDYTTTQKSNDIFQLEDNFNGFDLNDEVLTTIEKKKKYLLLQINKEDGAPMDIEVNEPCSIINNNNFNNKKKQSKSSVSSPETNDVKDMENSNKRLKKVDVTNEELESLDMDNHSKFKLSIPTFNLTSSASKGRRSVRKFNVDINDPIFKLPFEYGWKRELVYRTTGDSTVINRVNRNGDVYYYSPLNRKLRSLREIQEQLDLSLNDNCPLTIESFTFLKQPIGINDRSKELIREANTKLPKEDSFIGVSVRPKKVKTPIQQPFDYEMSDADSNKSSNKMKIVFKNVKQSKSKLKSKKDKSNLEVLNTSSSTPEYLSEDCQAIQSSETPITSPSKTDDETNVENINRRLSASDGEVIMQAPCGIRCPNSNEPATLMCAQCLVYYHPACVNLNANLKIVGYVCINCRSYVRQRNRRVPSSHTVVVGASESEQLRVEPIRIRQVHQASDTPNFFIDRTPIIKNDEPNHESDEHFDDNNSVINTVTCQGNVYETVMVDGNFHEQYVYEMKQTRGPSLMTCVVQEPKNFDENSEINGSLKEISNPMDVMLIYNYMGVAMKHVFKYLKIQDLLSASRVCTSWHTAAMDRYLWKNVSLKNSTVYDWDQFVETINYQWTQSLDCRRMLIPTKFEKFEDFWLRFSKAIKKATHLKVIELYRCPPHIVEDIIYSLPKLEILNATSLKNQNSLKDPKNIDIMVLNLEYLGQLANLTELRLKGLSGLKLTSMPTFEKLINLKTLSLTSIKSFPKEFYRTLETVTTGLEFFEIGDCECLFKEFADALKRFSNLTSLRLETCCGKWDSIAKDVFGAIRSLEKLKILELINIEFSTIVEEELEKCYGIRALLIIPFYVSQSATTNCHLIDCLKKLSKTLTHLVWGLTHELLRVTDLFITQYHQNQHNIGYNLELAHTKETTNNIPILRTRKPRPGLGEEPVAEKEKDKSDNVDILSVPALEKLLETMMIHAKTKVIKMPFSGTTRVYFAEHFNDI